MQTWFEDAKLGIFIHYGIYAVKGIGESWSFYNKAISYSDYMKQAEGFTASKWDAEYIADLIVESGAKYSVLTTKHHDGMALFDTQHSDLSIVKQTPAQRDIIREYTEAVRKRNLKVGLYYSIIDWSHPDYASVFFDEKRPDSLEGVNPFSNPADGVQHPEKWKRFMQFNRNQLKELLTGYGKIDLLWFDGDWERSARQWELPEFKQYLLSMQPELIINSRLQGHGDYKTPEQGLPITRPEGPWEFCTTINDSWGYQGRDNHYKSPNQLLQMFVDCISMGGNMLLDIGPREDGTIDERQEETLRYIGRWIREHKEAVYGTREGLMLRYYAGGSTLSKDKKTIYLFVRSAPQEAICLKGLCNKTKKISVLHSGKECRTDIHGGVPWFNIPGELWIYIDKADCHPQMTVIKIELDEPVKMHGGDGIVVSHN